MLEPNVQVASFVITADMKVTLATPKHQEMNGLCQRKWQLLCQLVFSFMNFGCFSEEFSDMALEHAWKVFSVLPLKQLCDYDNLTTPYENILCLC